MFILIFLTTLFAAVYSQNKGFLATFPTSVIPGDTTKFCIRFFSVTNDVVIKIYDEEPKLFESISETIKSSKIS